MSLERHAEEQRKKGGIEGHQQKTPNKPGDALPEFELYREQAQRMIDSYRRFFMTYAKDVSLQFHLSNKFYTDLEHGHVHMNTRWFAEKDATHEQILWAILHELSHFRDLAEDPQGMMKNFEYIKSQAKKTGAIMMKKWEAAYGQTDPEFIDELKKRPQTDARTAEESMNAVERAAYQFHDTFFNVLDDIYVNNLLACKAPVYDEGGSGGKSIKDLYKDKLFAGADYTKMPRHLQFIYTLIREEMVSDEQVVVGPEVEEILAKKIKFQGKEYTPKELVQAFLKPKSGRDTKASKRYLVIRKTLEPIFLDVLKKDIDEWQPKKPELSDQGTQGGVGGTAGEGSVNPFDAPYQQFKENSPDQLDDHDIEAWTKKFHEEHEKENAAEKDKEKENAKTAEERAAEAQDAMDKAWCGEHNVDYAMFQEFKKIEQEVAPYLADLSRFWQSIIYGSSRRQERGLEGYFPTGELDIPKVIEEWPNIEQGNLHEARVMKRMVSREASVKKPELIRVRILGDMSGSMEMPEGKKRLLQQCLVLMLSSLREFNTYLNMTRSQTKSKMETDSQAWIYGTEAKLVKRLRKDSGIQEEQKEIITIFAQAQETLGDTHDEKPLKIIFDSLTDADRERIAQKKIMEIIIEITDGGSTKPALTRREVDRLESIGVILGAFQIGKVITSEQAAFHVVWNENREEPLGQVVGERIEDLLPALTERLKKYLQGVTV